MDDAQKESILKNEMRYAYNSFCTRVWWKLESEVIPELLAGPEHLANAEYALATAVRKVWEDQKVSYFRTEIENSGL